MDAHIIFSLSVCYLRDLIGAVEGAGELGYILSNSTKNVCCSPGYQVAKGSGDDVLVRCDANGQWQPESPCVLVDIPTSSFASKSCPEQLLSAPFFSFVADALCKRLRLWEAGKLQYLQQPLIAIVIHTCIVY